MSAEALEVLAVVSLTLLGISLLMLSLAMVPVLAQLGRVLSLVEELVGLVKEKVLPGVIDISEALSGTSKAMRKGRDLGDQVGNVFQAFGGGLKATLESYMRRSRSSDHRT